MRLRISTSLMNCLFVFSFFSWKCLIATSYPCGSFPKQNCNFNCKNTQYNSK
ncbi:hypothetical protein AAHE18_07G114300 [Arachis hypogaea]